MPVANCGNVWVRSRSDGGTLLAETRDRPQNPTMGFVRSLPVLIPNIPRQRWSCHSCGNCCRTLVGHLTADERTRLDQQNWTSELGVAAYVPLGRGWALNKHADGACVFLDEKNQCRIHGRFGETAKPLACRIFPFTVRPTSRGWQAAFRFDCPSATSSNGVPLSENRRWLTEVVGSLPPDFAAGTPAAARTDSAGGTANDTAVSFGPRLHATAEEAEAFSNALSRWFRRSDLSIDRRVEGAAHLAATLHGATLAKTRGPRFAELLDLLFGALATETAADVLPATSRQRGMLRQLAFVHAEHATLAEARSGFFGRMRMRWIQLRAARRLRIGRGETPVLAGFQGTARCDAVERVQPSAVASAAVSDLLSRYVVARVESRSIFGDGYYGWPMFLGLGALCAATAAVGWLARFGAASRGEVFFGFEDMSTAIGVVDRAATRLPALGTFAERARMTYLFQSDGLRRLVREYRLGTE